MINNETKQVIIFYDTRWYAKDLSDLIWLRVCDYVRIKRRHNGMYIDIDDGRIIVEFRPALEEKSGGIRPDYVTFRTEDKKFIEMVEYCIKPKSNYIELKTLNELIDLIMGEKEKENECV